MTLRGANLTLKTTHTGYADLFAEWDWAGWIKFQVDLAVSAGCNCVRLIGDVAGVYAGTFSAATYRSRWRQLIDYCASLGVYVYVAGGGVSQFGSMTQADIIAVLVELAAELDGDSTVVAFDVIQESGASWALTNAHAVSEAVRAVCDRPISYSIGATAKASVASVTNRNALAPWVDFFDYHLYFQCDARTLLGNYWRTCSTPLMVGEFGSPNTSGQTVQEAFYDGIVATVGADPGGGRRLAGALAWSIVDGGVTGNYGLFSDAGTERTWLTSRLASLPTAP